MLLKFAENEGIDRIPEPARRARCGRRWPRKGLERPPVVAGAAFGREVAGAEYATSGPVGPGFDPGTQCRDILCGKATSLVPGGHRALRHALNEVALPWLAGFDHWSVLASLEQPVLAREIESSFGLAGIVAT